MADKERSGGWNEAKNVNADAGVQASARKLPVTVIASGRLQKQNLPLLGKDEAWVQGILQSYNCRMQDVYLLTSEPGGKLYFAAMQEDPA